MAVLKYRLTVEDYVQSSRFLTNHSPSVRRRKLITSASIGMIYFLCGVWIGSRNSSNPVIVIGIGVLFVVVTMFPLAMFSRWLLGRTVRRMLDESPNRAMFGEREAIADERGLTTKSENSESLVMWTGIERVVESKDFTFFYLSSMHAHAFPRRNAISGDPVEFIEEAKRYWLAANPEKNVESYR